MVDRYDEEQFLGYLEGDLTPEQNARFEKLLTDDPRLRNLVAQLLVDRQRLRQMPDEKAPADLMASVNERLERSMLMAGSETERRGGAARNFKFIRWAAYSGVAAMVLIGATFLIRSLTNTQLLEQANRVGQPGPLASAVPPAGRAELGKQQADAAAVPTGPLAAVDPATLDLDAVTERNEGGAAETLGSLAEAHDSDAPAEADSALAFGNAKREDALLKELEEGRGGHGSAAESSAASADKTSPSVAGMDQSAAEPSGEAGSLADAAPDEGAADAVVFEETPAGARDGSSATADDKLKLVLTPATESPSATAAVEPEATRQLALRTRQARAAQVTLELSARDAAHSQQRLVAWAADNRIDVVEAVALPTNQAAESKSANEQSVKADEPAAGQVQAPQRVVLLVRGSQVPELLAHMNRQNDQRVVQVTPQRANARRAAENEATSGEATLGDAAMANSSPKPAEAAPATGAATGGGANVAMDTARLAEQAAEKDRTQMRKSAGADPAAPPAPAPADDAGWTQLVADQLGQLPAEALADSSEVSVEVTIVPEPGSDLAEGIQRARDPEPPVHTNPPVVSPPPPR